MRSCLKPYDAFISHVAEDREEVVDPIYKALSESGFRIWHSSHELDVGHSLLRNIEQGMKKSRYAIVVLSEKFSQAHWGAYELYLLNMLKDKKKITLIPVWHNISSDDVRRLFGIDVIDIYGLSTRHGLTPVIQGLTDKLRQNKGCILLCLISWYVYQNRLKIKYVLSISALAILTLSLTLLINSFYPDEELILDSINQRIKLANPPPVNGERCDQTIAAIEAKRRIVESLPFSSDLNTFTFETGYNSYKAKYRLKELGIPTNVASIDQGYGLTDYSICLLKDSPFGPRHTLCYRLLNKNEIIPTIEERTLVSLTEFRMKVHYLNFIRAVTINYSWHSAVRSENTVYCGANETEEYVFEQRGNQWKLVGVRPEHNQTQ